MPKCDLNKIAATLLKFHFGMGVLLYIYCIFSENIFLRTPLDAWYWPVIQLHSLLTLNMYFKVLAFRQDTA